jgi:hypothetical protein
LHHAWFTRTNQALQACRSPRQPSRTRGIFSTSSRFASIAKQWGVVQNEVHLLALPAQINAAAMVRSHGPSAVIDNG